MNKELAVRLTMELTAVGILCVLPASLHKLHKKIVSIEKQVSAAEMSPTGRGSFEKWIEFGLRFGSEFKPSGPFKVFLNFGCNYL